MTGNGERVAKEGEGKDAVPGSVKGLRPAPDEGGREEERPPQRKGVVRAEVEGGGRVASRALRRAAVRRRRRIAAALLILVLLAIIAIVLYVHFFCPTRGNEPVHVTIEEGETASQIAGKLHEKGVVTSANIFRLLSWLQGRQGKFKPGHYLFYTGMRYGEVFAALEAGPNYLLRLTVPEGLTVGQTAALVEKATGITQHEFMQAAESGAFEYPYIPAEMRGNLEGFLFPKTYDLPPDIDAQGVIELFLRQFEAEAAGLDWSRTQDLAVTPYQAVIVASLIEREAMRDEERPLVSAVIYNRLRIDMLLQIDATVQYALPEWKAVLTYEDLKIPSPYNTYLHKGLPPAPICSPGLASLKAALEPADVAYLYYVATGDGGHFFTDDYQEFLRVKEEMQGR